jgi:polyphenol oxidase
MQILSPFPECTIVVTTQDDGSIDSLEHIESLLQTIPQAPHRAIFPQHQHGTDWCVVTRHEEERRPHVDMLLTQERSITLAHMYADCVPIVLVDRKQRTLTTAHAGWKGLTQGIVRTALLKTQAEFHSHLEDMWLWIGPCIQKQSYRSVTPPLQREFPSWKEALTYREGIYSIDLPGFILQEAMHMGIRSEQIINDGRDTYTEPIFFSHHLATETGDASRDGRFGVFSWLH